MTTINYRHNQCINSLHNNSQLIFTYLPSKTDVLRLTNVALEAINPLYSNHIQLSWNAIQGGAYSLQRGNYKLALGLLATGCLSFGATAVCIASDLKLLPEPEDLARQRVGQTIVHEFAVKQLGLKESQICDVQCEEVGLIQKKEGSYRSEVPFSLQDCTLFVQGVEKISIHHVTGVSNADYTRHVLEGPFHIDELAGGRINPHTVINNIVPGTVQKVDIQTTVAIQKKSC